MLAADFVCCFQDRGVLQQHAAEAHELCEKQAGRIEEARAVIIALLGALPAEVANSHELDLAARAQDWLKEV